MKKEILSLFLVLISFLSHAQFDYTPTGRFDVPVRGMQWGLVGGGFTAMLNNRDDIEADKRLDPQMMNFSYAAGIEYVNWFQNTIGFGVQALYWKGGAAYKGVDSPNNLTMSAKSDFTYLKVPFLVHFKSYNRYYPDRRTRFTAMFGPYIALLGNFEENIDYKNVEGKVVASQSINALKYVSGANGEIVGKLSGSIYNPIDLGFVVGFGGEVRLWRRTVIALQLRADIGISNVENTKGLKITYDSDNTKEYDFKPWDGKYAKFIDPNATDIATGWVPNRPATKNLSMGAFLSLRKYLSN